MPIVLKAPRIIVIHDRGQNYTYTVAPIQPPAWKKYFDGIVNTSDNVGKNTETRYDNSAASAELVRVAVTDVFGFQTAGDVTISSIANWRDLLPMPHLLAVASCLRSVERVPDENPITLGQETVVLSALWGVNEGGTAMMRQGGLVHRFLVPSIEHQRRYSRDSSRSVIVGGSRTGRTQWFGVQNTLAAIYDDLILSVEGYQVEGNDLGERPDLIKANMDTYHKVAAADALFAAPTVAEKGDEEL